jgi:hypothetical protein
LSIRVRAKVVRRAGTLYARRARRKTKQSHIIAAAKTPAPASLDDGKRWTAHPPPLLLLGGESVLGPAHWLENPCGGVGSQAAALRTSVLVGLVPSEG